MRAFAVVALVTCAVASTPNDRCFCSNHPDGCTSCDHGCHCKPTGANTTMLGAGNRALFSEVGTMTCTCSNHPEGCTACENGCECGPASGGSLAERLGHASGEEAEAKADEPPLPVVAVAAAARGGPVASTPNDRCFCSNHPDGCTSCDHGCHCKPTGANTTMLGAGNRALFGEVGTMTCTCSNHPEGCTSCDNGCECGPGPAKLGSGSANETKASVEDPPLPVATVEAAAKGGPVASTPNDRCFCSNHPDGCTSCDDGCHCKPSSIKPTSNMTVMGVGNRALFGEVGAMTCTCSNHPEGCTSCDNGCECGPARLGTAGVAVVI